MVSADWPIRGRPARCRPLGSRSSPGEPHLPRVVSWSGPSSVAHLNRCSTLANRNDFCSESRRGQPEGRSGFGDRPEVPRGEVTGTVARVGSDGAGVRTQSGVPAQQPLSLPFTPSCSIFRESRHLPAMLLGAFPGP